MGGGGGGSGYFMTVPYAILPTREIDMQTIFQAINMWINAYVSKRTSVND